jgi:transcriptional regulator with XRE-family HTH domain
MSNGDYLKLMGSKIKAARKANNISLRKLGALCKTDMSNLCHIENGKVNTCILTLKVIADVLKMDVKEFL